MTFPFTLEISSDRMKAWVCKEGDARINVTADEVRKWLNAQGVISGIMENALERLARNDGHSIRALVAEGVKPAKGQDGKVIFHVSPQLERKEGDSVDYRDTMQIFSAETGDRIATIADPEAGTPGVDVYGNMIVPKPGKAIRLKIGPNAIRHGKEIFAVTDGEVSFNWNVIQVNPFYVVDGDVDLSIGNLHFVGNVIIKGNVRPGYKIRVGGDLKVFGMIEGSDIQAGGSIYVKGGIYGESDCQIKAGAMLKALYINEAHVHAFGDIEIGHYILHSYVTSYQSIRCKNGQLIGGVTQAGKSLEIRDAGNIHYTRTHIHIGQTKAIERHKSELDKQTKQIKDNISKLMVIANRLEEMKGEAGFLEAKERALLLKHRRTRELLQQQLLGIREERMHLEYRVDQLDEEIIVHGVCYPNLHIQIGKYAKPLNQAYRSVRFIERGKEIAVTSL